MSTAEAVSLRVPNALIVGAAEIAELLGVSRQRVDQLTRRPEFPAPVAELASGRFWVRAQVERWAVDSGRIERSQMTSQFEYRILPWMGLISTGGSSPYDSLQVHLNEQGTQGWRFDQRVVLDYGTQQIEYAIFVKEIDDEATVRRKRESLLRIGRLIEDIFPIAGLPREEKGEQAETREKWNRYTVLLRQELTTWPPNELPRCRNLARQGGRQTDERSTAGEARNEVTAALEALAT